MAFQTGQQVAWDWGNGTAEGKITQIYTETVTRTLKGSEVTRHGSDDTPALLIEQEDGDQVLKSCTEVRPA
ncbi:conserved hypothetical protein (plasmid) [Dinoroseobacter shibae DFL 12 = DSM 16493]|jgi:hypothetical protein|uniref:Hypervirulence associated protein TUDOR domain-containing protein n=1 Tax=Dinoroseobacter shibae (strain DSM 16493 / NCIMB 14021 / DFL 12) TaxID=398580 RepID=A8LTL0_DINSH|nr:DUF2945 domain-containing protein [Dinoroseobacter shibae]ABV95577.1 conserved hypothetical protein [Dinoroseobacter shibae DFL 12 = DSM 16493]URF48919.1 DUF2945 domain-containing protein [Dinoroseobacter shibae]URF53231.1 DUF2945 domain-containing protein [Dinoroseobacter shibae]